MVKRDIMRAYVTVEGGGGEVREVAKPGPDPDEVLIKTQAIALNPTDWKSLARAKHSGAICGCDFAGVVVRVGADVTDIKEGDRVAGATMSCKFPDRGAFAEYVRAPRKLVWRVPEGTTPEEAATLGVGPMTAAQALFFGEPDPLFFGKPERRFHLPWPGEGTDSRTILIWSAASSVGQCAIQLAKLIGLTVVATASPKHEQLLRGFGADFIYDYREDGVEQRIAKEHPVDLALDCYGFEDVSRKRIQHAFGPNGGHIVTLIFAKREGDDWRENVSLGSTLAVTTMGFDTNYGAFGHIPRNEHDVAYAGKWLSLQTQLVAEGKLKPNPIKVIDSGLDGISEGMQYMKDGKVSGEKLVVRI